MKIGFSGTRYGMSEYQGQWFRRIIWGFKEGEFHHGDCIGADKEANDVVDLGNDLVINIHPAWNIHGTRAFCQPQRFFYSFEPKNFVDRDKDIVDMSDLLIAAPLNSNPLSRSGTWTTIRYAKKVGKPVIVLPRHA